MSQFAYPIFGRDLTNDVCDVWNVTSEYSNEIVGILTTLLQNDTCLVLTCPNGEDWYEIYYGIDISSLPGTTNFEEEYKKKLNNINGDFAHIFSKIVNPYSFEQKKATESLISAFDAETPQECVSKMKDLCEFIKKTPPKFEAIFSF